MCYGLPFTAVSDGTEGPGNKEKWSASVECWLLRLRCMEQVGNQFYLLMSWAVTKNSSSHPSFPGGISTTSAQGRWKDSKQTCSCMRWCINNASSPCRLRIEIFVACMYVMAWLNCLLGYSRVSHEVQRNKIKWSNNGKMGLGRLSGRFNFAWKWHAGGHEFICAWWFLHVWE